MDLIFEETLFLIADKYVFKEDYSTIRNELLKTHSFPKEKKTRKKIAYGI